MIREAIAQVVEGNALSRDDAKLVMAEMMRGSATQSQIASFITAIRMRGVREEELVGFALAMREGAQRISAPAGAVDLCGTGGDGLGTFNVSTVASFVTAAAGVPVAKHGNRSISSKSGSADLFAALGIPYDLSPKSAQRCLDETSLCFMFAPVFHSSMRNVAVPRREIGIRTFFNVLGPLTNPAGVKNQLVGTYDGGMADVMARVLRDTGTTSAMIVHGRGMDEITLTGETSIVELRDGKISHYDIRPQSFGFDLAEADEVAGGEPMLNASIALDVLKGGKGPRAEIVAMNAGAAIYVAGKAPALEEGVRIAADVIRGGKGLRKLKEYATLVETIETERQLIAEAATLVGRRLMPGSLSRRAADVAPALATALSKSEKGSSLLSNLDPELVARPSALSILCLNRAVKVSEGLQNPQERLSRSTTRLSDSLRSVDGVAVIGEFKPRSPSSPPLTVPPDPDIVAEAYVKAGVAGISVLAEPDYFYGGAGLFARFRRHVKAPMLFKDFVVSEEQLALADSLGADAVLLVAKALTADALDRLAESTIALGMQPFVELHDEKDAKKLASLECLDSIDIVGVNCRDLRTLQADFQSLTSLRKLIPTGKLAVAESGLQRADGARLLREFDAVLAGSIFMRTDDVARCAREVVSACREVRR